MTTTYLQLEEVAETLPSAYYYDEEHFKRELSQIWYWQWLCVGRVDKVAEIGDYQVVSVGDQSVIITRSKDTQLRAFHNTCRHRGSILCEQTNGKFRGERIVCPYHSWTYSLEGKLTATPRRLEGGDFDAENDPLYDVAVGEWAGFAFINLNENAAAFSEHNLGDTPMRLVNWNLAETVTMHSISVDVACNWKVF